MPDKDWSIVEDFTPGFLDKRDPTQAPPGSLMRGSQNVVITDGDRVGVRGGISLLGDASSVTTPIKSNHVMKKRDKTNIFLRTYAGVVEYRNTKSDTWANLNNGYTSGQVFGFADHNINDDNNDYVYFCNAVEAYTRWTGDFDKLNGALVGAEAAITIDGTVFTDDVFFTGTAASVTTTTVVISPAKWATDIWNGFYVRITSGAQSGKISKISATSSTQLTFTAIAGLSGTPTFEIRQLRFDEANKKLRIGTTDVTYTGYSSDNTFSGASGTPAASDGAAIAQAVEEFAANPKGNIFLVQHTRMYVSGVKDSPSTIHYSKIADATDFTFSSPRVADDGGTIDTPEGGGPITGLGLQEDVIYVMKEDLIKTLTFTQDGNDLPTINPLVASDQVGPIRQPTVFKVDNILFFVNKEGGVKSVTRAAVTDFARPKQLSDPIVNFADDLDFTDSAGIFFKQKAYVAAKQAGAAFNDVVLVYNFQKEAWEAPIVGWNVAEFVIYNGELHFGSSTAPETYKALDGTYDDNDNPYASVARFSYHNFGSIANPKDFQELFMEGFIAESTTITITVRYGYLGSVEERVTTLSGTEEDYIVGTATQNALGVFALGTQPLAHAVTDEDAPNDIPKFRVYLTTQQVPFYEMSVEVRSETAGDQWEVLRFGLNPKLKLNPVTKLKKKLS